MPADQTPPARKSKPYQDPPNRFASMDRDGLYEATWAIRRELASKHPRSPAERRALAADTEQLLQVLTGILHPGPTEPAYLVKWKDHALVDTFMSAYRNDLGNARCKALNQAAMFVLGSSQAVWDFTHDGPGGEGSWYQLAWDSEEGLRRGLEAVEARRQALAQNGSKDA